MPVVVLPGEPPIPGFNIHELGAALGVAEGPARPSLPRVLDSFDRVITAILRATAQLSHEDLAVKVPNRDRDLRELIHDIFFKALTWAPETGPAVQRHAAEQKGDAARYPDVASLLRYGASTQAALRTRFAPDRDYGRTIETADGPMPLGDAVAWLADHSAHHLRQIYWLMEHTLDITPRDTLDLAALPGITLQAQLW